MTKYRMCPSCCKKLTEEHYYPDSWKKPKTYNPKCRVCCRIGKKRNVYKGKIYIVTNKAWEDWCKVGATRTNIESRIRTYNTGSPFRDYDGILVLSVSDVFSSEKKIHKMLTDIGIIQKKEWFNISKAELIDIIENNKDLF